MASRSAFTARHTTNPNAQQSAFSANLYWDWSGLADTAGTDADTEGKGVAEVSGQKRRASRQPSGRQDLAVKRVRLEHDDLGKPGKLPARPPSTGVSQSQHHRAGGTIMQKPSGGQKTPSTSLPPSAPRAQPPSHRATAPVKSAAAAPPPPSGKAAAPFIIDSDDDSSSDEIEEFVTTDIAIPTKSHAWKTAHAQKEAQRLASERLRREAAWKNSGRSRPGSDYGSGDEKAAVSIQRVKALDAGVARKEAQRLASERLRREAALRYQSLGQRVEDGEDGDGDTIVVAYKRETTPDVDRERKSGGQVRETERKEPEVSSLRSSTRGSKEDPQGQKNDKKAPIHGEDDADATAAAGGSTEVVCLEVEAPKSKGGLQHQPEKQADAMPVLGKAAISERNGTSRSEEGVLRPPQTQVDAKPVLAKRAEFHQSRAGLPQLPKTPVDAKPVGAQVVGVTPMAAAQPETPLQPHDSKRELVQSSKESKKPLDAKPIDAKPTTPQMVAPGIAVGDAESEAERQRKIRGENSRKQYELLQAKLRMPAAEAKQVEVEPGSTGRHAAEDGARNAGNHSAEGKTLQHRRIDQQTSKPSPVVRTQSTTARRTPTPENSSTDTKRVPDDAAEGLQERQIREKVEAVRAAKQAEEEASHADSRNAEDVKRQEEEAARAAEERKAVDVRQRQEAFKRQLREKREAEARRVEEARKEAAVRMAAKVKEAEDRTRAEAEKKAEKERQEELFRQRSKVPVVPSVAATPNIFASAKHGDPREKPRAHLLAAASTPAATAEKMSSSITGGDPASHASELSDVERARQQRVQALKDRNERNRLAARDADEHDAMREDEQLASSTKPVSLNSFAGMHRLKAIQDLDARPKPAFNGEHDGGYPRAEEVPQLTPTKPMSLNSAAGLGVLSREQTIRLTPSKPADSLSKSTVTERGLFLSNGMPQRRAPFSSAATTPIPEAINAPPGQASHSPANIVQSKQNDPTLGEILPEDIKLMMWRDADNQWPDIIEDYEEATSIRKTAKVLRKRYNKVKEAVADAAVGRELLQQVSTGDAEAREQLNRAVHGTWPLLRAGNVAKLHKQATSSGSTLRPVEDKGHKRSLGEILPEDLKILRWKNSGMDWTQVAAMFEEVTGRKRNKSTLQKRRLQVQDALDRANIDDDSRERAEAGSAQAVARVNELVRAKLGSGVDVPSNLPYVPKLGEILSEDAKLVMMRDSGVKFDDLAPLYQRATGVTKHKSTLYARYYTVKAALDSADISRDLLKLVADGDKDAGRKLNQMVRNAQPASASSSRTDLQPLGSKQPLRYPHAGPLPGPHRIDRSHSLSSLMSVRSSSDDLQNTTPPTSPEYDMPSPGPAHPATSGKTMNEAAFQYYLDGLAEVYAEESATEEVDEVEQPEFTSEDYCHFAYQVQRREITSEELEEEVTIEMKDWLDCGNAYTDVGRANVGATKQVYTAHDQTLNDAIHSTSRRTLEESRDEDQLMHYTLSLEEGQVQVRVAQQTRTYQDHIKPSSTVSWVNRTSYYVMQRVTDKPATSDELFGEQAEPVEHVDFDGIVYTTLELANARAIEQFLDQTFHSTSINLTIQDVQKMEARKGLLVELEAEDESALFKKSAEDERHVLEVWVEVGKIAGPRNI